MNRPNRNNSHISEVRLYIDGDECEDDVFVDYHEYGNIQFLFSNKDFKSFLTAIEECGSGNRKEKIIGGSWCIDNYMGNDDKWLHGKPGEPSWMVSFGQMKNGLGRGAYVRFWMSLSEMKELSEYWREEYKRESQD